MVRIRIPRLRRLPRIQISRIWWQFFLCLVVIFTAGLMAFPNSWSFSLGPVHQGLSVFRAPAEWHGKVPASLRVEKGDLSLAGWGIPLSFNLPLRLGLDIQGGTQITLEADMSGIPEADRATALEGVTEVIRRRVDLFGVTETSIRTSVFQDQYRLVAELPGIQNPEAAIQLIGTTAQLSFQKVVEDETATESGGVRLEETGLTGKQLKRATVQFDPQTNQPTVAIEFDAEGGQKFAQLTGESINRPIAILLDNMVLSAPVVNEAIYGGTAVISGGFDLPTARTLTTQLNAGALPVPVKVVEQTTVGPTLGQESLEKSVAAGVIGLIIVAVFMIVLYGWSGFFAILGLLAYGIITLALYKQIPITLTLPGIAGLFLSIGMAVDANILTFERIKDELRTGKAWKQALHAGFGRSWESIKDANLATLSICFLLFNPLEWGFLHTSGPVRGFAFTLALGIGVSLFTGVFFSRILLQLFLAPPQSHSSSRKEQS